MRLFVYLINTPSSNVIIMIINFFVMVLIKVINIKHILLLIFQSNLITKMSIKKEITC